MASQNKHLSRRQFLTRTTRTAAGFMAATTVAGCTAIQTPKSPTIHPKGANERINLALIGIRGRGMGLAPDFAAIPGVAVKTLCDVDENLFDDRVKKIAQIQGFAPQTEYDLRRVLDDKDIDAVVIAAPNHWHALATIWACQAGKHVYVEKPACHNVHEGRKMIDAARKYNRLVQVGFQNRSIRNVQQAIKFLHDGKLGEIYMAKGLCYKPREDIGRCPDGIGDDRVYYLLGKKGPTYDNAYMQKVHYELWLGPAPQRPFNYNRFHYNWHWHWDYGGGDIANQGPHQFDVARWGLNKNEHPTGIYSAGGYFAFKDSAQETANTQTAIFEYADGKILQFEVRGLATNKEDDIAIGNLFYGTEGWMHIDGSTWKTYLGRKNEPGPGSDSAEAAADPMNLAGAASGGHLQNFISAIRSANPAELNADIEAGYLSSTLPLLANISYRLKRNLQFDPAKERFIGDNEADKMLTRPYRAPFVVPANV